MTDKKQFPELKHLVEKAIYHRTKSEEYTEHIVEFLKDMGYINDELIMEIVNEIILNTNSPKTSSEYVEEIFENLNVEGNF